MSYDEIDDLIGRLTTRVALNQQRHLSIVMFPLSAFLPRNQGSRTLPGHVMPRCRHAPSSRYTRYSHDVEVSTTQRMEHFVSYTLNLIPWSINPYSWLRLYRGLSLVYRTRQKGRPKPDSTGMDDTSQFYTNPNRAHSVNVPGKFDENSQWTQLHAEGKHWLTTQKNAATFLWDIALTSLATTSIVTAFDWLEVRPSQ